MSRSRRGQFVGVMLAAIAIAANAAATPAVAHADRHGPDGHHHDGHADRDHLPAADHDHPGPSPWLHVHGTFFGLPTGDPGPNQGAAADDPAATVDPRPADGRGPTPCGPAPPDPAAVRSLRAARPSGHAPAARPRAVAPARRAAPLRC